MPQTHPSKAHPLELLPRYSLLRGEQPGVRAAPCATESQVNPVERTGTPRTAQEILNRVNEVSFNATLLKELRMIAMLRHVSDPGNREGARWAQMRIHRVASAMMIDLGYSSKLNAEWEFLTMLRDEGRRRSAEEFLTVHAADIGVRSTLDLDSLMEQV